MRTLLLAAVVLHIPLFRSTAEAQTTFAPAGASWTYSIQSFWTNSEYDHELLVAGDTVIQGHTCQRIVEAQWVFPCGPLEGLDALLTYVSGDSVYWYDAWEGVFKLFVPFDAVVGTSWRIAVAVPWSVPVYCDTLEFSVMGVDTLAIDGLLLRRLHVMQNILNGWDFSLYSEGWFTERLGHSYYLFPWMLNCSDADMPNGLICYGDPDMSWPDPDVSCAIWLGAPDPHKNPHLLVSPTVLTSGSLVTIELEGGRHAGRGIEVTDALGRAMGSHALGQGPLQLHFDRSGAYFLVLHENGRALDHQRILVQ